VSLIILYRNRYPYKSSRPRYVKTYNRKRSYARKRQAANVAVSKALYKRYRQPQTLSQGTEYSIRRMYYHTPIVFMGAFLDGVFDFQLGSLPGYTEMTVMFDQYRVDKWVVHFIPCATMCFPVSAQDSGQLLTAVDFDGGAAPIGQALFCEYESVKVHQPFQRTSVTVKPRSELLQNDAGGATVQSTLTTPGAWFDCSNVTVKHYGVRWGSTADNAASGGHQQYNVWYEVFVTFKNTR